MAKFKVGDKARVIYSKKFPERVGEICTIVSVSCEIVLDDGSPTGKIRDYGIDYDNIPLFEGKYPWAISENRLEPIIELGSWDEIEASIGWNPTKTTEEKEANYSSSSSATESNVGSSY